MTAAERDALRDRVHQALALMAKWKPDAPYDEWATRRDQLLSMMDDLDEAEGRPVPRRTSD